MISPPAVREYLPSAISNAVYQRGLTHPATVYPIAIGAGSGVVGWLFNMPLLYIAALSGVIVGPLWAVLQIFFMHDKIRKRYISNLNKRQKKYERHVKKMLVTGLDECRKINGAEMYADQGKEHFNKIDQKLKNVKDILDLKINESELTYGRFSGAAEQVALTVLDNLKDVVTTLKSAGSIDAVYIKERLQSLSESSGNGDLEKQKETLLSRLELRNNQFDKVNNLLTKNEEAMTEMEKISAAVSEWRTDENFSEVDFESAISRLQELAAQAGVYK